MSDQEHMDSGESLENIESLDVSIIEKADPTAGDQSQAAATGGGMEPEARFIKYETPASKPEDHPEAFQLEGSTFLEPPCDPKDMYQLYRLSALLQPIVDALETNVYKPGYILKPVIDFDQPESRTEVHDALVWEKSGGRFDKDVGVTEEEVEEVIEKLKTRAIIEKHFLDRFFQEAVPDMSYRMLRILTGQDKEVTGNAYWEIIRDTSGKIARLQWLPSLFMRATKQEKNQITCNKLVRNSVLNWAKAPQIRRFRRYAQITFAAGTRGAAEQSGQITAWFKEYGDPRVMSRDTGKYYATLAELQEAEKKENEKDDEGNQQLPLPATEVLHLRILYGGSSVYGKPKFTGAIPALVGSRELDEENLKIASDEAIPSMMLLVAGGFVGSKAMDRLEGELKEREKGRKGILLIEAQAAGKGPVAPTQQPTIQVERTKALQATDALFQKYDARNEEKVMASQRMPRALQGKDLGQNRATTVAMMRFAEEQVFKPSRMDTDEPINSQLFADLGIICWKYETQSMQPRDPQILTEIVTKLVEAGLLRPDEGREIIEQIFNQKFPVLEGLWSMFPPRVLTVLLQTKNQALAAALLSGDREEFERLIGEVEAGEEAGEEEEYESESESESEAESDEDQVKGDEEDAGSNGTNK